MAAVMAFDESAVRRGLPVSEVVAMASVLDLPVAQVVAWLQIPERTWARRKRAGVLDPVESDRLARLVRLRRRAAQVVGGPSLGHQWLLATNRALHGRTPLEVASTEVGADAVFELLGRIEYGVFT